MPTSFLLFFEFLKVGLFTFGGGLASLPFLYNICQTYNWFSETQLTQLIAISSMTPGPIGLNMATFAGYTTLGIYGSIISSFALVLPMIIITSQVFRLYKKFSQNRYIKSALYLLRPTSCALIFYVGAKLVFDMVFNHSLSFEFIDYKALATIVVLFIMTFKLPANPVIYMLTAGIFGAMFYLFS